MLTLHILPKSQRGLYKHLAVGPDFTGDLVMGAIIRAQIFLSSLLVEKL
jgi:hypothetical protein